MRYLWQHALHILDTYRGELPLHHYLKQYYRQHPKLGSRDRRALGDMAYSWYRCSKAFLPGTHSREELIIACLFLCNLRPKALQQAFPQAGSDPWPDSLGARMELLSEAGFAADLSRIFPYPVTFSAGITAAEWHGSLLQLPRLFLRVRKDRQRISRLLAEKEIEGAWLSDTCVALPNGTPVDSLLPPDAYVVQDASSQATGQYFNPRPGESWWDCCSGAGGKSLLLKDLQPGVRLTASDIRDSILHNLEKRFRQYRLQPPETITLDAGNAADTEAKLGDRRFDAIISDVPCSGAGTWTRTPEVLYFFEEQQLAAYSRRQKAILGNAAGRMAPGGRILYITCSVFREENESVVAAVAAEKGLEVVSLQLLNGIPVGADCLFIAELRKLTP